MNHALSNVLTLEVLENAYDRLFPKLYYAISEHCEPGALYHCKETGFNPECIIFHPDDEVMISKTITARRLVPIQDEPPEEVFQRLRKELIKELEKDVTEMFFSRDISAWETT